MARHHMTASGPVPFTAEEEIAWDAQEQAAVAQQAAEAARVTATRQFLAEKRRQADALEASGDLLGAIEIRLTYRL